MEKLAGPAGADAAVKLDLLRVALDALPIALYLTGPDGRLAYFNQAAATMFGRVPSVGLDRWCVSWRLYHLDGTPMAHEDCPMAVTLREGRPVRGVAAIAERPDGTRFTFMPYPTPLHDGEGRLLGAVNALVDVTEQHGIQQQLQESERRYRDLVGLLPVGLYTCAAPSGAITFYNEKAAELWGRAPRLEEHVAVELERGHDGLGRPIGGVHLLLLGHRLLHQPDGVVVLASHQPDQSRELEPRDAGRDLEVFERDLSLKVRLETRGLLSSRWEDPAIAAAEQRPRRRLYRVTAEGEAAAQAVQDAPKASANPLKRGLAPS